MVMLAVRDVEDGLGLAEKTSVAEPRRAEPDSSRTHGWLARALPERMLSVGRISTRNCPPAAVAVTTVGEGRVSTPLMVAEQVDESTVAVAPTVTGLSERKRW